MIKYIVPSWPVSASVRALSTIRTGGVSRGSFCSLNLGNDVGDDLQAVIINRKRLQQALQLPADPVWLNQVHGSKVIRAEIKPLVGSADSCYTKLKHIVCAVLTADCLPILLADTNGHSVAAVHGGWRGLLAGVIENAIDAMECADPVAWLGPAIGSNAFEVGTEVRQAFLTRNRSFVCAFERGQKDCWFADIYRIATIILHSRGVKGVFGGDFCTYTDSKRFFSYRREGQTGRMATLIWRE